MRFLWLSIILIIAASPASSEPAIDLDSINGILQKHPVVTGDFVQTRYVAGLEKPLVSVGNFIFLKSRGIYWHTMEPIEFETSFLKADLSGSKDNSIKAPGIAGQSNPMHKKIGALMMNFLGGDLQSLEKQFRLELVEEEGLWRLTMYPKRRAVKKQLSHLAIEGVGYISEISIVSERNGTTRIRFNNIEQREVLKGHECGMISTHLGWPGECPNQDESLI